MFCPSLVVTRFWVDRGLQCKQTFKQGAEGELIHAAIFFVPSQILSFEALFEETNCACQVLGSVLFLG